MASTEQTPSYTAQRMFALLISLMMLLVSSLVIVTPAHANTLEGVWHAPYGDDELYATQPTERSPRDPMADEDVTVRATTWPVAQGQSVWVTWSLNGSRIPRVAQVGTTTPATTPTGR